MSTVRFIQISDTHFGPDKDYVGKEGRPWDYASRAVDVINSLPVVPDFVIHTGDVSTDGSEASYIVAADLLGRIKAPFYCIPGNHDDVSHLTKHLEMGPCERLESRDELTFAFSVNGVRFLAVDAHGPASIDPHGNMPANTLAWLDHALSRSPASIVFMHFSVLPLQSPWLDENMRLLNWEEVHATLARHRNSLKGVFVGHIHQSTQNTQDGVTYYSAASTFFQLTAWPSDQEVGHDRNAPAGFNFVTIAGTQLIVQQAAV